MKVFSRSKVGLRSPVKGYSHRGTLRVVSWHHGGPVGGHRWRFKTASETWRQFQNFHINERGWSDIAYHFGIDALGRLYEGRPVSALPAAVGNHNTGSLGIVFMVDGGKHKLTRLQRKTMKELFERGIPSKGVPPLKTVQNKGHQEFEGHTTNACPGVHIQRHLKWRRSQY